jgi:exodeoxyribonuclease III
MRVASWNINSLKVRLPQVLDWLAANSPDVLGLQETKLVDEAFPVDAIRAAGYEVSFSGQPTYNGVALLSRVPPADVITGLDGLDDPQRRVLGATIDGVRVLNLYVPNGQEVGSEKYAYKLGWLTRLHAHLEAELTRHARIIIMGDFNIAPDDRDVHDPKEWAGKMLCSEPERAALRRILGAGLRRYLPAVRTAGRYLQLVGLPRGGLPAQPGPADRPGARQRRARRSLQPIVGGHRTPTQ